MPIIKHIAWRIYLIAIATGVAIFLLSYRFAHRMFNSDTALDDILAAVVVAAAVMGFMYQRELRERALEAQKMRIFKATMTTVQDLLGNFLGNMQYMRSEASFCMAGETLELFDHMIEDVSAHLHALGNVEAVTEKKMAIGMGIGYPLPPPPDNKTIAIHK